MATTKSALLGTAASIAASAVLVRTLASDFLPSSLRDYLSDAFASLLGRLSSQLTITVEEFDGPMPNHMYKAAESYLATKLSPSTRRIRVAKQEEDSDSFEVRIDREQEIVDIFEGIEFRWRLTAETTLPSLGTFRHHYNEPTAQESKLFELSFHKKHMDAALNSYLPFVVSQAKAIKAEAKTLKLHTNNEEYWESVNLRHPATFETMALDADVKREVMEDLARFVKRKDYYKKIGKAWKRGYLLYGPPGTGKSSLVAAMANLLRFDVYDLELTEVRSNSGLRSLLGGVANRSILVVEDIDCAMDLGPRENKRGGSRHKGDSDSESDDQGKVTLAGLLNFVDGLWSSCGDERIIIFTTNHKNRLDSALLRPGRMDVHIHMSYCTPTGFRVLASNYHSIDDHPLFGEIEGVIGEAAITPAEVAEELMKTDDTEVALQGLIKVLREKKNKEDNEAQNKEDDNEAQNKEDEEKQD